MTLQLKHAFNFLTTARRNARTFHALPVAIACVVAISFSNSTSLACPAFVQNLTSTHLPPEFGSVCAAVDRYHRALNQLEEMGLRPAERLADLHAPRMINPPTWLKKRHEVDFNPWFIYEPAPDTWELWETGAQKIDEAAANNFQTGAFLPLDEIWLKSLHEKSLSKLNPNAGAFRNGGEVGKAITRESAVTLEQVNGIKSLEFKSVLGTGEPLVNWIPTQCYEEREPEFQKWYVEQKFFDTTKWPPIEPQKTFRSSGGNEKQCGYLVYAKAAEIKPQLELWYHDINSVINTWSGPSPVGDPLELASHAQRMFIAIHPFERGNGRMSRFAMEYILKSIGLPSPVFVDMDEDIYSSKDKWANEIGDGIARAILIAEHCAESPRSSSCKLVPKSSHKPDQPGILLR